MGEALALGAVTRRGLGYHPAGVLPSVLSPIRVAPEVRARLERLELPFDAYGLDPYGIDREELGRFFTLLRWLHDRYFDLSVHGAAHIPARGRAMLVGNHSGGWAVDALLVIASAFFDHEPPRLAQGMAEKFLQRLPFSSQVTARLGQVTGLPGNAARLLRDERLLLVFPEGARGTAKLFPQRDGLVRFGTGFVRLALKTRSPIVPFAFVGGGEAIPTVANLTRLGKLLGVPYVPVTPYLLPVPLPVRVVLLYGAPMVLEGTGDEPDEIILEQVARVRDRVGDLIRQGRKLREGKLAPEELDLG